MINFDYYGVAQELIFFLEQNGHVEYASNLRSAIEEGSTGTEIFMALRFHLSLIIEKKILVTEMQRKAELLMDSLNDALK